MSLSKSDDEDDGAGAGRRSGSGNLSSDLSRILVPWEENGEITSLS